jgi:hypothetical protein
MVWHTNHAKTIEGWENIYATKNIDFHSYVINIHSFGPKPICVRQAHESPKILHDFHVERGELVSIDQ